MMKPILAASLLLATASPALAQRMGGDPFADADTNGDGRITRAEYAASRAARFDKMDRNKDGVVSRDDFGRVLKFRPQAGEMLDRMIEGADANGDGKVTRAEMAAAPMPMFEAADTNRDGVVDAAERSAARDRMQAARKR